MSRFMSLTSFATLVGAVVYASILMTPAAQARVLGIDVERRVTVLTPDAFTTTGGDPIGYELIEGRVHFGFDPGNAANARVMDLAFAPRGEQGLVRASGDFSVLQPVDPAQRRGTAIIDVPNRGRRLILGGMNRARKPFGAPALLDPGQPTDWGDGFLMQQGLTIAWVGWQADAPRFPDAMRLNVPRAQDEHGAPIRGLARSDWVVDEASARLDLAAQGHDPIPPADSAAEANVLTRRAGREAPRQTVPRSAWRFDPDGRAIVATGGPFEAGWIYELVYVAESPPILGLGFAAFRDFARFVTRDPDCPFAARQVIAHGVSQSGRFLRHFLYDGFNRDELGRRVFDGMMIQIGGAGRGGFNHRFGHPGRVGNPYANFFYPGDDAPFTGRGAVEGADGLFDRALATQTLPRLFQINTGYEYWGRGASLIHMTPDGQRDVAPHSNERLYHVASAPHYSLPFPPRPDAEMAPGLFVGSSVDTSPFQRALLRHLLAWVESDVAPPPSAIPTIAGGTLVEANALAYPIRDLTPPRSPHVAYRQDFGPDWSRGIVGHQPPRRGEAFAIRVPAIDALGNEATGLRGVELRAPIGTYTPWALRHGMPGGADEMVGYVGSFLPLAATPESRREEDDRPSLRDLYPSQDAYESKVRTAIDRLVAEGWMLPVDADRAFEAAIKRWTWAATR